ncbi:MAG: succinate dehydrogenase, partial [Bacteroidales bacterium]|nr:succinate dehydrogenase [Bacteroidales bacterium]
MKGFLKCASVTKKITLAIVGGFLMVFLLVHAGINLCMLRNDGGEWFRAAAHFMGTNYIVKVFEVILFAALIVHVVLAVILQIGNWMARPVGYKVRGKAQTAPGSRFMIYTGILVAIFLVIHLMNFYFVKLGWVQGALLPDGEPDFYTIAQGLFN